MAAMARRIFGLENEYGVTCTLPRPTTAEPRRGRPVPLPPGRVVGPLVQRLPGQRRSALSRRGVPPRVRHPPSVTRSTTWSCTTRRENGSSNNCWSAPNSDSATRASAVSFTCSRTTPTRPATHTVVTRTTGVWGLHTGASRVRRQQHRALAGTLVRRAAAIRCGTGNRAGHPHGCSDREIWPYRFGGPKVGGSNPLSPTTRTVANAAVLTGLGSAEPGQVCWARLMAAVPYAERRVGTRAIRATTGERGHRQAAPARVGPR